MQLAGLELWQNTSAAHADAQFFEQATNYEAGPAA